MNEPSIEVVAYTAGLIDGEGSVSLAIHHGVHDVNGLPKRSPVLLVQLSMTHECTIRWLHEMWGIGSVIMSYRPKRPNHNIAFSWRVYGEKAAHLLSRVLPYLRAKRCQAELALLYMERPRVHGKKIGEDEMRLRLAFRDRMIELNKTEDRCKPRGW
jgi:hypothetical protein